MAHHRYDENMPYYIGFALTIPNVYWIPPPDTRDEKLFAILAITIRTIKDSLTGTIWWFNFMVICVHSFYLVCCCCCCASFAQPCNQRTQGQENKQMDSVELLSWCKETLKLCQTNKSDSNLLLLWLLRCGAVSFSLVFFLFFSLANADWENVSMLRCVCTTFEWLCVVHSSLNPFP